MTLADFYAQYLRLTYPHKPLPPAAARNIKQAFYAGAWLMFQEVHRVSGMPAPQALPLLRKMNDELLLWAASVHAGANKARDN